MSNTNTTDTILVDEKCGEDSPMQMPEYRPYGGATSFDELDANKAIGEYAMNVEMETAALRGIINNILDEDEDEMPVDQKIAAMQKAASDYQSRVAALKSQTSGKVSNKSLLTRIKDILEGDKRTFTAAQRRAMAQRGEAMSDGSFPIANRQDLMNAIHAIGRANNPSAARAHIKKRARAMGMTDALPDGWKTTEGEEFREAVDEAVIDSFVPDNHGFKVYRDAEGDLRWLSLSSNAFEDLDKELFTTKALEEAIEYADKTEERGPLLVFHVPTAEIGQCDYQAMAGRFLVESGTFDDTPLGRKAVEYFVNSDEEHQVSIGYQYLLGDEEDGQYDWLRIKERSVCPYGTAANPWTDFKVIRESPMEQRKVEALEKIFGKDLSAQVISAAEARTKELEESVRFKEAPAEEKPQEAEAKAEETPEAEKEAEDATVTATQLAQLVTLFTDFGTQLEELSGLKDKIEGIEEQVKELKKSEDERMSEMMSPRWSFPGGIRPTENNRNTIDEEKEIDGVAVKELVKEPEGAAPNPAQVYIDDLLGIKNRMAIG